MPWRGLPGGWADAFTRPPPGFAAVTGWAWRGCAAKAIGVVCPERRAGRTTPDRQPPTRGGLAGHSLRSERTRPAGSSGYRWVLLGGAKSDGPGQRGPGLPGPERGPGVGQRQRAEAPNRGRNAGDRGRKRGQGLSWPMTRSGQSQTRTDSG